MTTYADYKAAQEIVGSYRAIALDRVTDYVRAGESMLGKIRVNDFAPGDDPADVYILDFSMEIAVRKNDLVLVWATPMDDGESIPFTVPLAILDGVYV
jgi:hypothetical protein